MWALALLAQRPGKVIAMHSIIHSILSRCMAGVLSQQQLTQKLPVPCCVACWILQQPKRLLCALSTLMFQCTVHVISFWLQAAACLAEPLLQVNRIMHYKKFLLKEVPYFEARAKASASLAVVQDYLLASIHHLQEQQQRTTDSGTATLSVSPPAWQGTANVRRPAASWIT